MKLLALLQIVGAMHMPDAGHLRYIAERAGLDHRAVLAVAWQETRKNLNPRVRDSICWYTTTDSTGARIAHHEKDCAVGRFQIRPSTARRACPGKNVWTYAGNVDCFIEMFGVNAGTHGVERALLIHNHSRAYVQEVFATIGRISIAEGDNVTSIQTDSAQPVVLERAPSGNRAQQPEADRPACPDGTGVSYASGSAQCSRDSLQWRSAPPDARGGPEHAEGDASYAPLLLIVLMWCVIYMNAHRDRRQE